MDNESELRCRSDVAGPGGLPRGEPFGVPSNDGMTELSFTLTPVSEYGAGSSHLPEGAERSRY